MEIKLAGSKISNNKESFKLGDVYDVPVVGYIRHYRGASATVANGKERASDEQGRSYIPISNGVDRDGNKYLVCCHGKHTDILSAFTNPEAYVDENIKF